MSRPCRRCWTRARDERGDTPLHVAATPQPDRTAEDCHRIIAELVAHGADPEARNWFGLAPLHRAVAALLARGADPGHRDETGQTPLEAARSRPAMRADAKGSGPANVDAVVALLRQSRPSANR